MYWLCYQILFILNQTKNTNFVLYENINDLKNKEIDANKDMIKQIISINEEYDIDYNFLKVYEQNDGVLQIKFDDIVLNLNCNT